MRILKTIFLITLFLGAQLSFAQENIRGTKGKAIKQATVKVSEMSQVEADPSTPLKVPNKTTISQSVDVDPSEVIYMEPEGFRKISTREIMQVSPSPELTFQALGDNGTGIPPDVNGAVSPDYVMTTLNTQVRIQNRQGSILFTTTLSSFWSDMPNNQGVFDPKILYDPYESRWVFTCVSGSTPTTSRLYMAVSATDNPMGDWYMFWLDTDESNGNWMDYPTMGFNNRWITVTGNMYDSPFYRVVFVFDKMQMYAGNESPDYSRIVTTLAWTLAPAYTYDTEEEDHWLIASANGNSGGEGFIRMFLLSGPTDDPILQYKGSVGSPETWAGDANGDIQKQLGTSLKINAGDDRMKKVVFRNNKLWAVQSIYLPVNNPQRASTQWWELETDGTVLQRGRIDDPTNSFSYAYPSIAVNALEDVLIGHTICSSTQYASGGYSFRAADDEPNTLRDYYQYIDGKDTYYKTFGGDRNRWGDYTSTCVDPLNDYNFWTLQEYAETATSTDKWGTWWAFIKPAFSPITNFEASEVLIPTGETIDFTDLTAGIPDEWAWTFQGGTPASSTEQNPQGIQYNAVGSYTVSLEASNSYGADTDTKVAYITVSSTLLPEVAFEADQTVVCIGQTVSFTDLTLYSPNQWEWQFDPADVTFVDGTDATSENPKVVFDEAGNYSVSLKVWNLNGSSELTEFDMIASGGFVPYYKETFEMPAFSSGFWTVENPDADVTWELYEVGGTEPGNMAAGVDMSEYTVIGERDRLISPSFNLLDMSNASLDLMYAYAKRHNELTDSLIIYVSGDCGEIWTRVYSGGDDGSGNFATHPQTADFWPEEPTDWCGHGWGATCIGIDLTPWAGLADVRVAFETYSGYGNPIFIDNVQISQFVGEKENLSEMDEIKVFPNPTSGDFKVVLNGETDYTNIELVNQVGQLVYSSDIKKGEKILNINKGNSWKPGIYFLKINSATGTKVQRVVMY